MASVIDKDKLKASDIAGMKTSSREWMSENFYDEWAQVYKAYKCERDPEKDPNDPTKDDDTQTSIGMPDTWSVVRRKVARITAQVPNLRYRTEDKEVSRRVGWKLMYDWDRGGVQRLQKKHVAQSLLFGWSVRPWSWDVIEHERTKRIDPFDESNPDDRKLLDEQYGQELQASRLAGRIDGDEFVDLIARHGRGKNPPLIPVKYKFKKYEGPKTDFLFVGDCFPEPNFQTLQTSSYFIVQRWRDKYWMDRVSKRYPDLGKGFNELITMHPNGTNPESTESVNNELRRNMLSAIGRTIDENDDSVLMPRQGRGKKWLITECHYPGRDSKISYIAEDSIWIGEIPYPYELEGKIAFSELVLIDDLLTGIGDSDARIIRGLQQLHDRQVNTRTDLIYNLLRPYCTTTSQELFDNPDMIKRGKGLRLLPPEIGPDGLRIVGEQSAMASAIDSMREDQGVQQLIQQATGESNSTMMANVDPQQGRTATGARLLAYNQDLLTKDMNDAFATTGLRDDAEIMYLLNRSELSEPVSFDSTPYSRDYAQQAKEPEREPMIMVSPLDFQHDGEVSPEVGSTLADDDQSKVDKAQYLYEVSNSRPDVYNVRKAAEELLIAHGKGKELGDWMMPEPPPPPDGPPPQPPRLNITFSLKDLMMIPNGEQVVAGILDKFLPVEGQEGGPGEGQAPPPPGGSTGPGVPQGPPPSGSEPPAVGPATRAALNK